MIKKTIKKIIGQDNITFVKQNLKFIIDKKYLHSHSRIQIENKSLLYKTYAQVNRHVFFGYYDLSQFDKDEKRLLVHVVKKGADPAKDEAELGYFYVESGDYVPLAHTNAWCWQQGARLRWHPTRMNTVLFNDMRNGRYLTRMVDLETRKTTFIIDSALYDIDATGTFGLSVNFSRLQRLRPGYGYSTLPDTTIGQVAPTDDGIFYVDIINNNRELLVSLADLAKNVDASVEDEHYINHVSISPEGTKFMFFHIWTLKGSTRWKTRLYVYDLEDKKLNLLEKQDRVSHYNWIGNDKLLVTCWDKSRKQYYCIYDVHSGEKTILEDDNLTRDGHPSFIQDKNIFISDTYPLKNNMQYLFEYDLAAKIYKPIVKLYSEPRLFDEKRCDLHPRVSASRKYITIDTTYQNGERQVMLINNWRIK